jgi:hypothetical protein
MLAGVALAWCAHMGVGVRIWPPDTHPGTRGPLCPVRAHPCVGGAACNGGLVAGDVCGECGDAFGGWCVWSALVLGVHDLAGHWSPELSWVGFVVGHGVCAPLRC